TGDPQDNRRLGWVYLHSIAVWTWPALLIHAHRRDGDGPIPKRSLTDTEAALFLADLAAQGLLAEVAQLQFVEDPAYLDTQHAFLVVGRQAVGDRDDLDSIEA